MPALETLGPAKRKKHELQAESKDPETTGNEDREAASQGRQERAQDSPGWAHAGLR